MRTKGKKLSEYDREMLVKMNEQMERFLVIYHNIEGRLNELIDPENSDGGLGQVSEQIQEIALLYRHSVIPNEHPEYLTLDECEAIAWESMAFFETDENRDGIEEC